MDFDLCAVSLVGEARCLLLAAVAFHKELQCKSRDTKKEMVDIGSIFR